MTTFPTCETVYRSGLSTVQKKYTTLNGSLATTLHRQMENQKYNFYCTYLKCNAPNIISSAAFWMTKKAPNAKELPQKGVHTSFISYANSISFISLVHFFGFFLFLKPLPQPDYALTTRSWKYKISKVNHKGAQRFTLKHRTQLTCGSSGSRTSTS